MKNKGFYSINIVPMIDIMLVLLVIVLTTTTFIAKGVIPISLPKSKSATSIKNNKALEFYISKDNQIYLFKEKISLDNLDERLKSFKRDKSINISCDKEVKYQNFITLLDKLKELSFKNISLVTKK